MLIIAGLGRCGTSLISGSFRRESGTHRGYDFSYEFPDKYSNLQGIIKTHGLPPKYPNNQNKTIWCFGNPMDIVVSCLMTNPGFIVTHCHQLGGDEKNIDKIYDQDVMGLEKHFDAWYKPHCGLATIKYEKIYSHLDDIQRFVGLPMQFPDFRPRKTNWKKHWAAPWLKETYGSLAEKIDAAEDFKIW
jgi:hypothetical protein